MKQALRPMLPDLVAKVNPEVDKLVKAGFVREVQYQIWLTNIVLDKKNA